MNEHLPANENCECALCITTRKFMSIIAKLPLDDQKWMAVFYDSAFETMSELHMLRAVHDQYHDVAGQLEAKQEVQPANNSDD